MASETDSHNRNCFAYLRELVSHLPDGMVGSFFQDKNDFKAYDGRVSYANVYYRCLKAIENNLPSVRQCFKDEAAYKQWFNAIYENQNNILSDTYDRFKTTLQSRRLIDSRPQNRVDVEMGDYCDPTLPHKHTPKTAGSYFGRFWATISGNFKPMLTTSIPSTRDYQYTKAYRKQQSQYSQELRFGTQGQRHEGTVRLSPLFEEWLRVNQSSDDPSQITHVYFNLLGLNRNAPDIAGVQERNLTLTLHTLEKKHPNILVITLPADQGLMDKNTYLQIEPSQACIPVEVMAKMKAIAMGGHELAIQDFFISHKAKQHLYGALDAGHDVDNEDNIISGLLESSFKIMGQDIHSRFPMSPSKEQAIWFHFNKYALPTFILNQIQPRTWNVSCKDAIDRAGVASAYQNLIHSFDVTSPMPLSRDEFEQALHAAAALVKGRGLNHHYEVIWNAIDSYVDVNFETLSSSPKQSWLVHWRNDNTPHEIVKRHSNFAKVLHQNGQLLNKRLTQLRDPHYGFVSSSQELLVVKAIEMLGYVKAELFLADGTPKLTTGRRLLLEVITQTTQMALYPEQMDTRNLTPVLKELSKNSMFRPIFFCLKRFLDYFRSIRSMVQGLDVYGALARYSQDNGPRIVRMEKTLHEMQDEHRRHMH